MSDEQVADASANVHDVNESGASDAPVSNGHNGDSKPSSSKRKIAAKGSAKKGGPAPKGEFKIGDVVLHRLKGFPPWPSIIVDPSSVPAGVVSQKPSNNPFIIIYVSPENGAAKKKDGKLWKGYEIAIDPTKFMSDLAKARAAGDDEEVPEDEDELADEDEEAEEEPAAKKRKKPSSSTASKRESAKDKRAKLDKLAKSKKSKDTVEDEDEEEVASKPQSTSKPKSSNAKKEKPSTPAAPAAAAEAKEDSGADKDPLAGDAEAQRVKDWRHKLQRAFLGKGLPEADAMDHFDKLFKEIEEYDKMTVEYLSYSKIGKVMKRIAALDGVPRDDELKIRERAGKLNAGWQGVINGTGATPAAEAGKKEDATPDTNGEAAAAAGKEDSMQVDEAPKEATNGEAAAAEAST